MKAPKEGKKERLGRRSPVFPCWCKSHYQETVEKESTLAPYKDGSPNTPMPKTQRASLAGKFYENPLRQNSQNVCGNSSFTDILEGSWEINLSPDPLISLFRLSRLFIRKDWGLEGWGVSAVGSK